jgi:hypothetical protein
MAEVVTLAQTRRFRRLLSLSPLKWQADDDGFGGGPCQNGLLVSETPFTPKSLLEC